MPVDVALVDDHHLMRANLARAVNGMQGYQVTLQAGHGKELIDRLTTIGEVPFPRIAIVDLNMPVMDGFGTIAWLVENVPDILPLALTFDSEPDALARAVRAGARGYLLKTVRPDMLRSALDDLIRTGYHSPAEPTDGSAPVWYSSEEQASQRKEILERISPRELEFLLLACDAAEYPYNEIAARMGLHRTALEELRIGLFERTGLTTRTGLIHFALRWGLLPGRR